MTIKMDDARLALHYKIEVAKRECKSNEVVELQLIINAYDTSQARIAELEAYLARYMYRVEMRGREPITNIEKLLKGSSIDFDEQKRIVESEAPTITAGCYCTDIETEAQYVATCEALVKLGCLASGFYSYPDSGMCSYRDEYLINGNVGWVEPSMEISNGIYHAKGDLRHCFTTLVSHRDIIKAAED